MKTTARMFHLFSDETRLRILMLLSQEELFVCKLMAVLGVSQSLVSRNLAMLRDAGVLDERKDGKLVHYSMRKALSPNLKKILKIVADETLDDTVRKGDMETLAECHRFQETQGSCDMKTFLAFIESRKKHRATG